jgi:hypothetical protein
MQTNDLSEIAEALCADLAKSKEGVKRLKLKTLMSKFGYAKRSDANTALITQLMAEAGVSINPPIVRFGDDWAMSTEDWIFLSTKSAELPSTRTSKRVAPPPSWNADGWFDRIAGLELRTEREVETKFVIPLVTRLGYSEDDRYDGMSIAGANGSRQTTFVIDCALFNSASEALKLQPLLTIEAKRESLLRKKPELLKAHNQAKSYCLWTQCEFFAVTDSYTIQAFHIRRGGLGELKPIFACERHELREKFPDLYAIISKEVLSAYYLKLLSTTDEAT